MNIKKAFLGVLIALILAPSVSVAANQSALETQRIELMKQVIVLLQARVEQLQILLAQKYGIGPAVLGAATSTAPTSTSTEVIKKKRRGGGGGGGGGSRNAGASTEGPTIEELQTQVASLIDTVNGLLAEDGKTLGDCEWITEANDGTTEALQAQIAQLMSAINDLQNGESTVNGCPLLDVVVSEPLVLSMQGTSTVFTVTANQPLDPQLIEITLVEFDNSNGTQARDYLDEVNGRLDDAEDEINEAMEDGEATSEAEGILDEAIDIFDDAQEAFDNEDFDGAINLAEEANNLIDEAIDAIGEGGHSIGDIAEPPGGNVVPLEITLLAKVSDGSTLTVSLVKESGTLVYSADMRARLSSGKTFTGEFEAVFPDTIAHGEIVYTAYYEGNGVSRVINLLKPRVPAPPNPLGTELNFSLSSGNPDATDIVVDENDTTDGVTILEYTIEAEDGDIVLNELWVRIQTGFANVGDVVHDITLSIDGELFDAEATINDSMTVDYLFDIDGDVTIGMGEEVVVKVLVDFKAQDGNYVNGETIKASVPSALADLTGAEGVDDISPENISGSATGDTHTLVAAGIVIPVDGVETSTDTSGENDQIGEFTIEFEVTAIEADYYITDNAFQSSGSNGILYQVEASGASAQTVAAAVSSTADEDTNGVFTVREGETETFTLHVTIDAAATGQFRVILTGVNFSENDDGTSNTQLYTPTPPQDFRTGYQQINS